jgi:hypothetical protein
MGQGLLHGIKEEMEALRCRGSWRGAAARGRAPATGQPLFFTAFLNRGSFVLSFFEMLKRKENNSKGQIIKLPK